MSEPNYKDGFNRVLDWIKYLFIIGLIILLGYFIFFKSFLSEYFKNMQYLVAIVMFILFYIIWIFIYDKLNVGIKGYISDWTNIPNLEMPKATTEKPKTDILIDGKPYLITFRGKPIKHDLLKIATGLELDDFVKKLTNLQKENVKLNTYFEVVNKAWTQQLLKEQNEYRFTNVDEIMKELLGDEKEDDRELIQQEDKNNQELPTEPTDN